jgi:hypothetical protein
MSKDKELIEHWVSIQSKEAQKHMKIQSAEQAPLPFTIHIDKVMPSKFIPRMPQSAGNKENYTAARVTCADTLVGCFYGYARSELDFFDTFVPAKDQPEPYNGGYEICRLDFEHRILPGKKLVPDVERTGENWLVSYSPATTFYKPKKIGKVFFTSLTFKPRKVLDNKDIVATAEGYFTHNNPEGIYWDEDHLCLPGFYKFELVGPGAGLYVLPEKDENRCIACSESEFEKAKKPTAATLSYQEKLPSFMNW